MSLRGIPMFNTRILLQGFCSIALIGSFTLACAAQPPTIVVPNRNPFNPNPFNPNPFGQNPFNPYAQYQPVQPPVFQPTTSAYQARWQNSVSNYFTNRAITDSIVASSIHSPFVTPYQSASNPFITNALAFTTNPMMNPFQMNNPMMSPFQMNNPMMMNPMMNNPMMMNPFQMNNQPMNPWQMMNPMMMNPMGMNPFMGYNNPFMVQPGMFGGMNQFGAAPGIFGPGF
jgi:hypothetical protein